MSYWAHATGSKHVMGIFFFAKMPHRKSVFGVQTWRVRCIGTESQVWSLSSDAKSIDLKQLFLECVAPTHTMKCFGSRGRWCV